jgi:hypothetical protein
MSEINEHADAGPRPRGRQGRAPRRASGVLMGSEGEQATPRPEAREAVSLRQSTNLPTPAVRTSFGRERNRNHNLAARRPGFPLS